MDDQANFDFFGEEISLFTEPNWWIFEDHNYSRPLEADEQNIVAVNDNYPENPENSIFGEQLNSDILNDILQHDLTEEVSDIKIDCTTDLCIKDFNQIRYPKLEENDLNAFADANCEKSTRNQTKWAVSILKGKHAFIFSYFLFCLHFHFVLKPEN